MSNELKEMLEKEFLKCKTIKELQEVLLEIKKITDKQMEEAIERICKE